MYIQIQSILVICCSLFLLIDDTHIYNLPAGMYMRLEFMFLSMIIHGSNSPSWNIDVCLRPLIDKLKHLWSSRALIYDVSRIYFLMKIDLMWTINDFPTYEMISGWSTHGKLVKNCITWCQSTVTLCLVFNLVSRSFLVLV
jgi:hypothetical protein